MSGYTPWMAGSVAAAKKAQAAALARRKAELRAEYNDHRAEARACGYDVESFEEWLGADCCKQLGIPYRNARTEAEDRVMNGMDCNTFNYFADMF